MSWLPQTVAVIAEAVAEFVKLLMDALGRDDSEPLERVQALFPEPLKSRLALRHAEERARRAFAAKKDEVR